MTNTFLLWSILSLIVLFPKSFKTRNTVYQADTLRESFHRILERENELHLYFKCTSDYILLY